MLKNKKVQALFISDVHLGSKGCKAEELLEVLKEYHPETLYIVGDFIDGWLLKKRHFWPQAHTNIIRKVLSYSKKGTKVIYITGNHDDFLRSYDLYDFGNITIVDEVEVDGVWVVHGDKFDGIVMNNKWLAVAGSVSYELIIYINEFIKWTHKKLGLRPRSFSKWVKAKVKGANNFITAFETVLATEAKKRNCHTVICGHIHTTADHFVDDIRYINTGDWIENYSYVTLNKGEFKLHIKHHD
jgi:UDP-2,3-diacylglucosamine pyrophosphatase LpxH